MEKAYLSYFLLLGFGFLSIYNHLRLEELKGFREAQDLPVNDRDSYRQRRETNDKELHGHFDVESLTALVQQQANKTFQTEIKKLLKDFMHSLPVEKLCEKISVKCQKEQCNPQKQPNPLDDASKSKQTDYKCSQGPRGPPGEIGPRGPPGQRGLGIHPPKLVQHKLNITANLTDGTTFECVFFGSPIPEVEWKSIATKAEVFSTIDVHKSWIQSWLKVSNITWSDRGEISCEAKNLLGRHVATGKLNVLSPPIINLPSGPLFVHQGINYQFPECKVRSNPDAKITWRRVFWPLPSGRHSLQEGILNISRVKYEDGGFYICEAENFLGKSIRKIKLKSKQMEFKERPSRRITAMGSVTLSCSAYGNPSKMAGSFKKFNGETYPSNVIKSENLFTIQTTVRKSGTFSCNIISNGNEVQSYTLIKIAFYLNSTILTEDRYIKLLGGWLNETSALGKYKLCWRSSRDGESNFYTRCNGKAKTITIAKLKNDRSKIYGGYTGVAWATLFTCTFDDSAKPLCTWTQDTTDNLDWTRHSGQTSSTDTGPNGDHTSGTGNYLYVEASDPVKSGDTARLLSKPMSAGKRRLRFFYTMNGKNTGYLHVKVIDLNTKQLTTVFTKSGDQGKGWKEAKVVISSGSNPYQIIIESVRGSDFKGDTAIDDISVGNYMPYHIVPNDQSYSKDTFIFDMMNEKKYPMTDNDGTNAVCHNSNGPCFGNNELYFNCCSLRMELTPGGTCYNFNGNIINGQEVDVEVFYKVD